MGTARRAGAIAERIEIEDRPAEDEVDPAFTRAILKIALELRKNRNANYEVVVNETIAAMKLDAHAFRRYLGQNGARNMGLLLAAAKAFGV